MLTQTREERFFLKAKLLSKKGKFKAAKKHFNLCVSMNFQPSLCYLNIGIIQLQELELSEAFQTFQMVLTSGENIGDVYYYLGKLYQIFDNQQESASNYKKAIIYSRNEINRLLALEEIENSLNAEEWIFLKKEAYNFYMIRSNIPNDEELLIKGIIARLEKDYDKAIKIFSDTQQSYPEFFPAYYELAKTYIKVKKYHFAYNTFKKIRFNFLSHKLILSDISKICYLLRKYKESIHYTRALIKNTPKNHKFYFNLATNYAQLDRYNPAVKSYRKAIELNNNFFPAYYNIAVIYQKNGFLEESLEYYTKAFSLKPENPELNYNMGLIYFEIQDYFQALYYFMKAYTLDTDFKEALNNYEVISNIKPLELNLTTKVSLAFTFIVLIVTFVYFFRWI
jgi:tetratricopeptide (TPR) repeat protein